MKLEIKGIDWQSTRTLQEKYGLIVVNDNDTYYVIKNRYGEDGKKLNKGTYERMYGHIPNKIEFSSEIVTNFSDIKKQFIQNNTEERTSELRKGISQYIGANIDKFEEGDFDVMIKFLEDIIVQLKEKKHYKLEKTKEEIKRATVKDYNTEPNSKNNNTNQAETEDAVNLLDYFKLFLDMNNLLEIYNNYKTSYR